MNCKDFFFGTGYRVQTGLIATLILLALAPVSSAATYYVNNKVPLASDSNPGTEERPWRTVAKASQTVRPGDRVEWVFDDHRSNDVRVRIVSLTHWVRLATTLALDDAPFEVGIGNDDLQCGRLLFAVSSGG